MLRNSVNRSKRIIAVLLSVICIALCMPTAAFCAEQQTDAEDGVMFFDIGAPDENGFFDVVFSMEKTQFLVCEVALRFNSRAVVPVTSDGAPAAYFAEFASAYTSDGIMRIGEKLDAEKGYFLFTLFAQPGSDGEYVNSNGMLEFDEKQELYRFRFKRISDENSGFEIASIYDGGVYDEFFPDGAVITSTVKERPVAKVVITDGENVSESKTVYYYYSELYPGNFTVEQRLENTVYLVVGDYAAAVDGSLKAIDPSNRQVVPYEKNGEVFFPVRFLCESLGYTVDWDEATQTASITDVDGNSSVIYVSENKAKAGEKTFEGGIVLVNDRIMVPSQLLAELCSVRVADVGSGFVFYDSIVEWDSEREAEKEAVAAMEYVMMPFFRMFI